MKRVPRRILTLLALIFRIAAFLLALMGSVGSWSCSRGEYSRKVQTINFGSMVHEFNALVYIAQDREFFSKKGLKIVLKEYDSGVTSTDALVKGEVDLAGAAEFVLVGKAFEKKGVRGLATIDKSQSVYLAGRAPGGIKTVEDLKGKKIGLTRRTVAEFYLGRFLDLHGMSLQQVTMVDIKPAQYVAALARGEADTVVVSILGVDRIKKQLGVKTEIIPLQSSQLMYYNVLGMEAWISGHRKPVTGFLQALREAEDYVFRHPDQSKAIIQKRLKYDDSYMARVWPEHQFSLSLDQTLIVTMKDEAQWMINNNLTDEKQIPDFIDYVYIDGLKTVKPEAVNIIR
jgi:ABC-type nitrate/sulfonate/bicarbonate transport system substrate-binding protein